MTAMSSLRSLREQNHLTQDELAERLFVTRQAVSRWENGETVPNTETLKQLSKLFHVSINGLLGQPLICQCCGMPLDSQEVISREADGELNEEYCKWCYNGGTFAYSDMKSMRAFLVAHMTGFPADQAEAYVDQLLPTLRHWKTEE